jgi:cyclic pyranopterin phosphate synthase
MTEQTLTDPFGRRIDYLRLSVTDRCDLRCGYCLPKGSKGFEVPGDWLDFAEITRAVGAFASLGVRHVRLTGGEPLVRRHLPDLAARLSALPGVDDLSISSNCTRMESQAAALYRAGVRRLNVSLDSLCPAVFKDITGGGDLTAVLRGIAAGRAVGFNPIRVNTVVMKGVNEDEIEDILDYCAEQGFTLRLIETMPIGVAARQTLGQYIDLETIRQRLMKRFELIPDLLPGGGPARYYRLGASETRIGFITPLSRHFCDTCNRVRLTAEGTLYLCLGQNDRYALRPLLRAGITDDELVAHLRQAIALKPQRHEMKEQPGRVVRFMSSLGG